MNRGQIVIAACVIAVGCSSRASAGETLPLYPRADLGNSSRPINPKITNQAVSQGDFASLYTDDSPTTVLAWYSKSLPKSCVKNMEDEYGGQFTCATRRLTIQKYQGRTLIVIGPRS